MNHLYIFIFLSFLCICTAQSADPSAYFCSENSKISNNSQISRNIVALLAKLASGTAQNGFIATSYGEGGEELYGIGQCRGDVSKDDCSTCIQDASRNAIKLCPNEVDVRIWYEYCFLRYNGERFFGQVDTTGIYFYNVENVTDNVVFNEKLGTLMDGISSQAVKPGKKGLGKGESKISTFETLYALVQCTRDLSEINCAQCLAIGISNFPRFCNNKRGCRVLYSSCYIRYELYPFFYPLDDQGSSAQSSGSGSYKSIRVFKP